MADAKLCAVEGCRNTHLAKGYCRTHYQRLRRLGDANAVVQSVGSRKSKKCSVDGCDRDSLNRGYCTRHFDRYLRHGDATAGRDQDAARLFAEAALKYEGDDCLFWPFSGGGNGYGRIQWGDKRRYVHQLACEAANGPRPTFYHHAAHECGNGSKGCCNPRHMSWKTRKENEADKLRHGTHQFGERNCQAKLTEANVAELRELYG